MTPDIVFYYFNMLLYTLAGGCWIMYAVEQFKSKHYFRFGLSVMFALSDILFMTKFIFS